MIDYKGVLKLEYRYLQLPSRPVRDLGLDIIPQTGKCADTWVRGKEYNHSNGVIRIPSH